ncbi:SAF domain-containing protein [Aneurinibacillus thermoaerophilus]|uniref:SAF domain-containing protein n=1 Tax=Aneurinibacillus thermoaerophilus TaxID=143495 RepID=UPI002E1CC003|nr:SAF domain-containing protein [Aneurinibacillus thermoaerophilus]
MIKKYRGVLLLVIGLIFATISAYVYQASLEKNVKTAKVVRVKKKIVAYQPVTKEQIEIVSVSLSAIPPNAITTMNEVVGKNLNANLAPGTILQSDYFAEKDGDGLGVPLSEKKNPRLRVYTMPGPLIVKRGYVKVGDRVDVVGAIRTNKDTEDKLLASNVEIVAISKDEQRENIAVSLLLDVDVARKVHLFQTARGDIDLFLRPYQSQDSNQSTYRMSELVGEESSKPYDEPKESIQ